VLPNCSIAHWIARASSDKHAAGECPASVGTVPVFLPDYDTSDPILRRTQAQAELMTYADQVCDSHIAGIYSSHSLLNFDLGFLTTLFSGGAAVAAGRTATNLAAGSALFSGTRSLINSEVFYGYIGPAVMREIRSLRGDLRTQITEKRACSVNDYPPQEAINDALIYHDACSFSTGLASLLSKAGSTRIGEDKLRVTQLKTMAARLTTKKEELKAAETELGALSSTDAQGSKGEVLRGRVARLSGEIDRLDSVLTFSGVVEPDPDPVASGNVNAALIQAKADYETKKKVAELATGADKKSADDARDRAWTRYDSLTKQWDALVKAEAGVVAAEKSVRDANAKVRGLEEELVKLNLNKGVTKAQRDAKQAQIDAAKDELSAAQKALGDAKTLSKSLAGVASASSNIEFGIQRCAPLTPPTVRQ
jgi:hypothetical protein